MADELVKVQLGGVFREPTFGTRVRYSPRRIGLLSPSGTGVQAGSHDASATAAVSFSATAILATTFASSSTASAVLAGSWVTTGSIAESSTGAFSAAASWVTTGSVTESATADFSSAASQVTTGSITEAVTAAFDAASIAVLLGAVAESATGAFSTDASLALEARYARPISTVAAGAWLYAGAASHEAAVNETDRSDAEYVYTTSASTLRFQLTQCADPGATAHQLRLGIPAGFSPSGTLLARLYSADSLIASWNLGTPTADSTVPLDLTDGERDSITDYTDLELELEATA